jgi:hypothetical protein
VGVGGTGVGETREGVGKRETGVSGAGTVIIGVRVGVSNQRPKKEVFTKIITMHASMALASKVRTRNRTTS